jgi:hypothetical protein
MHAAMQQWTEIQCGYAWAQDGPMNSNVLTVCHNLLIFVGTAFKKKYETTTRFLLLVCNHSRYGSEHEHR